MLIRDEQPGEAAAIHALVRDAFDGPDEADLINRLRAAGDAIVSFVAEEDGEIVGHILLSPIAAAFPALALAPLAVGPDRRAHGIGGELVRHAIGHAGAMGWRAIFVLGDPAYYQRFGFSAEAAAGFASPYAGPHLMVLPLGGALPATQGTLRHAPAFAELG
ncbi:GNAT family N-acetyltransferase [Ancylobacter defluvii]|uniref:N-acetyltransferase n=1 Tax=Ancylobacter defluvii TaxID=1282440 RepID=A0A9W6NBM5_9HYPH|nr:N-acetyltransferase [Ancylobacter defluvii]MBS7589256.1 N-acetyltransferase [Ancylobacter defluvii]GLK84868.1 N-acetyltransferase [Ancylobacter defluvii]